MGAFVVTEHVTARIVR